MAVSLALRGRGGVSERLRSEVLREAERIGYRRDAALCRAMSFVKTRRRGAFCETIALLNANKNPRAFYEHPTLPEFVRGIERGAKRLGYGVDRFWLYENGMGPERLAKIFRSRGIRGGIILGHVSADSLPIGFSEIWRNFKFVSAGIKTNNPMVDFVSADKFLIARRAAEKAIEKGCKRLGLVLEKSVDDIVDGRFSGGFLRAQLALPEKERIPPFLEVAEAKENPKIFYAWMKKYKPDSILSISNQTREWLESDSVTLPEDIGIICIDTPNYGHEWVGLDQNYELVGKMAVRRLSDLLNRSASSGSFGVTTATVIAPKWTDVISIRHKTYSNKPSH